MTGAAISVRGARKRFGRVEALRGVDLRVPHGSIFALIGPNGAGKTTLFGVCCGFLRPDAGEVVVLGGAPVAERLKGRLGALPQDALLGRETPVQEHLVYLARLQGLDEAEARSEAARVLELVDLSDLAGRRAGALSHGQAKRVGVAQAFLGRPEVILLDEPTAGLDPRNAHDLREAIRAQRGERTIVVSSHNLQELEAICDQAAFLDKGVTVEAGAVSALTGQDAEVRVALGEGPAPVAEVRARVRALAVELDPDERVLHVRFQPEPGRAAEEVIGEVLRVLLEQGARIAGVSKGRTLEQRYLETTQQ